MTGGDQTGIRLKTIDIACGGGALMGHHALFVWIGGRTGDNIVVEAVDIEDIDVG